jgi:hypothetical protein
MITYQDIFEKKIKFRITDNYIEEIYQFQSNDDKGEFINQDGNAVAQLVESNPNNDWFAVAGIFMGQITLKSIQYKQLTTENQIPINLSWQA